MGLLLSVVITYVGFHEAIECMKFIISGIIPDTEPNFNDLVEYYTQLLQKTANSSREWTRECDLGYLSLTESKDGRIDSATIKYFTQMVQKTTNISRDWTSECGLGYLSLTEGKDGRIESATIKYFGREHDTTALLFSTKISSFGQDSLEENPQVNGDIGIENYTPTKTKTIISNTDDSINVGQKNISPTLTRSRSPNSFEHDDRTGYEEHDANQKLKWEYSPIESSPNNIPSSPLPEILFESYGNDKNGDLVLDENFLRSLDGIKYRPLQRNDPSGRRRSFRKRASSSSNSSKESRASREEELKVFTSLEEAEFKSMSRDENYAGFGSAPNLAARSYSRSRSREKSRERRNESPLASVSDETLDEANPLLNSIPKLGSFEEKDESKEIPEVTEEEPEVDFWANIGD